MNIKTDRLNAAFQASGLSQAELCKKTGITKGALSSYLSGRYYPKQQALDKLAQVLHVSVPYLMGFDAPASDAYLSVDEQHLLDLYRSLNQIGQRKVLENLEDLASIDKYIKNNQGDRKAV
jgi:transcriptional regulator with XRE-family HTH domain